MASLAELLAAKKLAAEQATPAPTQEVVLEPVSEVQETAVVEVEADVATNTIVTTSLIDAIATESMGMTDVTILADATLTVNDIVPRIRQLNSLSDMDAENEMKLLKDALLANPEAVQLMLPTDVGLLVSTLRRITKEAIINEATKKEAKKKAPKLDVLKMTKEQMLDVKDF